MALASPSLKSPSAPGASAARLSVVIPVYNEIRTIRQLLDKVSALPFVGELIVVDDGSKDGTRDVLRDLPPQERPPRTIHFQPRNFGKGAAVRAGFKLAKGPVVVIQDADLELDPTDLEPMLRLIESGKADVVFGSRFLRKERAWTLSLFANKVLTFLTSVVTGQRITDMETCYKMFRREVLDRMRLRSDRFGIEPELTVKTARAGYRIREVPIHYVPRTEGKKINWKDGLGALWHILVFRYWDRL